MGDEPAYRLEIDGLDDGDDAESSPGQTKRPWIGIRFDCCGAYTRVYRNAEGNAYEGQCPRCGKKVRLRVGDGGTDARFFVAE